MSFDGKQTLTTLEGAEQVISQGPTAAIVPIKQLGTNGGGYFGVNSSHPLEKSQRLHEYVGVLVDPDPSDGDGLRVRLLRRVAASWPHGFSP